MTQMRWTITCLLYTSDAADERSSVDLGGRRIIKKKKNKQNYRYIENIKKKKQYSEEPTDKKMNNREQIPTIR